jgi:hypothetical protein
VPKSKEVLRRKKVGRKVEEGREGSREGKN